MLPGWLWPSDAQFMVPLLVLKLTEWIQSQVGRVPRKAMIFVSIVGYFQPTTTQYNRVCDAKQKRRAAFVRVLRVSGFSKRWGVRTCGFKVQFHQAAEQREQMLKPHCSQCWHKEIKSLCLTLSWRMNEWINEWMVTQGGCMLTHSPTEKHLWVSAAKKPDSFCPLLNESRVRLSGLELLRSPQSPFSAFHSEKVRVRHSNGWRFLHSSSPAAFLCWALLLPPAPFPCFLSPWANVTSPRFCNIFLDLCQTSFLVSGRDFRQNNTDRTTTQLLFQFLLCFLKFRLQKLPLYSLGLIAPSWWTDGPSVQMKIQKNNFVFAG